MSRNSTRTAPFAVVLLATSLMQASAASAEDVPVLMPVPRTITVDGAPTPLRGPLQPEWANCHGPALDSAFARLQADVLHLTGVRPPGEVPTKLWLTCAIGGDLDAHDRNEGYRLTVGAGGIRIDAEGPTGVLRGFATLRQLVSIEGGEPAIATVSIEDGPRFAWRGIMLDVARHFVSRATIQRQIDAMEHVKLNVLHLHLSDNEGFRVESKRYPKLNSVSSHGEYLTQDDIRHLVRYAADRGVSIVPEFDVPGHSRAIVDAYPEVGVRAVKAVGAFPPDVALDPASPRTYRFLRGLIDEMASLFPGRYFHIGGDEVSDTVWAENPEIREWMARERLSSKAEVESHFARRVVEIVSRAGKVPMGWEEMAGAGVPSDVVIQAWQTSNATANATAKGHRTVVSAGYYLDLSMPADFHYLKDPVDPAAAGFTPEEAERARQQYPMLARYLTDALIAKPLPALTSDQERLVLGAEAPLWGELVSDEIVEHHLWPRAAALAERFWSPASVRDVADMYRRLGVVHDRLQVQGVAEDVFRRRMALRLSPGDAEPVLALLDLVTPTRNMAHDHRILAALRGQRLVQPLNSLADAAPVESLPAQRFAADAARFANGEAALEASLRARLTAWRDDDARFSAIARGNAMLEPALPASARIAALARIGLASLDAIASGKSMEATVAEEAEAVLMQAEREDLASRKPLLSFVQPQPPADLIVAIAPGVRVLLDRARLPR
jgi:hexosaminidase